MFQGLVLSFAWNKTSYDGVYISTDVRSESLLSQLVPSQNQNQQAEEPYLFQEAAAQATVSLNKLIKLVTKEYNNNVNSIVDIVTPPESSSRRYGTPRPNRTGKSRKARI
jgi:hypothetical protein